MRATSLTVAAFAAALLLTACDDGNQGQDSKADSACAELSVRFGPGNAAPAAGDTGNVPVTITNGGDAECVLEGLPGVELDSGDAMTGVPVDEAAKAAGAKKTTLTKEASTSFTLTYVRGEGGGTKSLGVRRVKIQLPGVDGTRDFKWSYGDVALKSDGKTPDASVSGFQQSGD
ncbi:DUF4232 domain-containing protein [Streptomyces caeruleatus]|uniref:DUF4232 domain-containing protein n=1 Tax=Streptomyces caeruleatus TaxID=661399 RepID=A0A101TN93_9ACTN|nr:DUF4232 domain-containing protein [Streptomyces caeruleatus]KUN95464.1 hypothetical protein AQJ67_34885 [Streptomyces caeruleatus]